MSKPTIIYTHTDEAPALATYSFLPMIRAFTAPAMRIAPPASSRFSVSVVLPASGCAMIANVRRRAASS